MTWTKISNGAATLTIHKTSGHIIWNAVTQRMLEYILPSVVLYYDSSTKRLGIAPGYSYSIQVEDAEYSIAVKEALESIGFVFPLADNIELTPQLLSPDIEGHSGIRVYVDLTGYI